MLALTSRLDVMNRLGRALADPTRSRILMLLRTKPAYPAAFVGLVLNTMFGWWWADQDAQRRKLTLIVARILDRRRPLWIDRTALVGPVGEVFGVFG